MQNLLHLITLHLGRFQNFVHALFGPQIDIMKSLFILLKIYIIFIARRNRCFLLSLLLGYEYHLGYVGLI